MAGLKQAELVERAIDEYVERHREDFAQRSYRARYAEASPRETTVVPEITEAPAALSACHRLAVATSKPRAFAEPLLTLLDLQHRFELIAAPDLAWIHRVVGGFCPGVSLK